MKDTWTRYAIYLTAIFLSVMACCAVIAALRASSFSFLLFFIFKEGAGIAAYLSLFAFCSLPAIPVFKVVMSRSNIAFSWGSTMICWFAGLAGTALAVKIAAATVWISQLEAAALYFLATFSIGFLLADRLGRTDALHGTESNGSLKYHEQQDYE